MVAVWPLQQQIHVELSHWTCYPTNLLLTSMVILRHVASWLIGRSMRQSTRLFGKLMCFSFWLTPQKGDVGDVLYIGATCCVSLRHLPTRTFAGVLHTSRPIGPPGLWSVLSHHTEVCGLDAEQLGDEISDKNRLSMSYRQRSYMLLCRMIIHIFHACYCYLLPF